MSRPSLGAAAIVALVAALLIPAVGAWQIMRARAAILVDTEQSARTLCHSLAQHATRTIEGVDLVLSGIVERVQDDPDRLGLTSFLERRAKSLRQFHVLAVVDAQGEEVADSAPNHPLVNIADRAYFAWARDHADTGLHIDSVVVSKVFGRPTIPLSRRIVSHDGSFDGVAVASLMPADFQQFYDSLEIGPHGAVALRTRTGRVLVRRPENPHVAGDQDRATPDLATAVEGQRSGTAVVTSPFDGLKRIVAFESLDSYPLGVSVGISTDDALARWHAESALQSVALVLASAALVALAGVLERNNRAKARSLAESREADLRYRLITQNSSDLIVLRPRSSSPWFYVSPSSTEMLGWSPEDLMTLPSKRYVHSDDVQRLEREVASLSPERPRLTGQYWLCHRSGRTVRVEAIFQLTKFDALGDCVIIAARDITARHHAEESLKDSEARYRVLADSTSDVITQLDLDFRRIYVSPASRAVFGYAPEEMLGRRPTHFIHPEDAAAVRTFAESIIAGAVPDNRGTTTYRFRHKEGHWIWIEAGLNVVREPTTGAPVSVICSLRDVSERQRVARHLERAKAAAETAARVKTEFLANMSHELRTPLTGILGIHDLLHNDSTLGHQQRRYLGLARDAGRSLLSIVNDVLDFTKMEAGQFSLEIVPFELGALIQSCGDLVQGDARRKSLRLETSKPDAPLHLMGDPTRLRQILLNLLTNAIKFTERGSISTTATYDAESRRLRVAVSDTGIGLPRDTLPLLFERFSQADASITRRYGGTGLGLAISKRLVDLMGGKIDVDSNLGVGSVFRFEVPLREAGSADRLPGAAHSVAVPSRLRILLAEDNEVNRDIISAMLQQRGYAVTVVADGAAAVAAVRAGRRFAIILMDLQMPVMDGLSATRAIRLEETEASGPPTPIIGLTANAMVEDVVRCREVGMDAHVAKPIDWSDLFGTIERLTEAGANLDVGEHSDADPEIDVLDDTTLEALARYIGRKRLEEMLGAFAREVEARVSGLDTATPSEIARRAHALVSLAGQLGFTELSRRCAEVETAARDGNDPLPIGEVRSAADRAVRAARRSRYARAA